MNKKLVDVEQIEKFLIDHYLLSALVSSDSGLLSKTLDKVHLIDDSYSLFKIEKYSQDTAKFNSDIDLHGRSDIDIEFIEKFLVEHYLLTAWASADTDVIKDNMAKAHILNAPYALYMTANRYRDKRKFGEAIGLYARAYELGLRDDVFLREAGESFLRHGTFEQYSDFFRTILANDSSNELARYVVEMIGNYHFVVKQLCAEIHEKSSSRKPKLILNTIFWGERFVDIFLNYSIPILLAEKNIPVTAEKYEIHYIITTTKKDFSSMQNNRMFAKLLDYVNIHLVELTDETINNSREFPQIIMLTNSMHSAVIECVRLLNLDLVFIYPDHIFSESFLTDLLAEKEEYSVLSGVCFRLYYDKFLLEEINKLRDSCGVLSINYRTLFSLLLEYLPEENYVNSATCFTTFPVYVCWKVGNEGLIAHVNHYCVWLICGSAFKAPVYPSLDPIDGFFLDKHLSGTQSIGLTSEKIIGFDLGENPLIKEPDGTDFDVAKVATWLKSSLTDVHQKYFEKHMKYSVTGTYDSPEWDKTIAKARSAISRIIMLAKHS